MKPSRSLRLDPRSSEYLERARGKPGEIFFDKSSNTVRCYDGIAIGGFELARSDLSNISAENLAELTGNLDLVSTLNVYNDPSWIASLSGSKITGRINSVVYVGDAGVVTNNMLTSSTVRFGNTTVALGENSNTITGLSSVTATTFNGAVSGNATTATRLRTPRKINGVDFDGTQDIVISSDGEVIISVNANDITGTVLSSTVVSSSLTSVGTLTSLNVAGAVISSSNISATGNVTAGNNITAAGSVTSSNAVVNNSVTVGNNATINNNVTVGGAVTATGNITTSSFMVSSKTPVNKTHLTNKKYVDTRSISMSVALS